MLVIEQLYGENWEYSIITVSIMNVLVFSVHIIYNYQDIFSNQPILCECRLSLCLTLQEKTFQRNMLTTVNMDTKDISDLFP